MPTEGYIGTGEAFTLHGQCLVPGQPQIPTRYADGSIADGGRSTSSPPLGWTCSGFEDSPGQNLLRDASYAWGPPVITGTPPLAADGTFVLPSNGAIQIFKVVNPIVRVTDSFTITKAIVDPNGVVQPSATFAGTYRCVYSEGQPDEAVVTGIGASPRRRIRTSSSPTCCSARSARSPRTTREPPGSPTHRGHGCRRSSASPATSSPARRAR